MKGFIQRLSACFGVVFALLAPAASAAPATLLFEDNFNAAIPGWTAVLPPGTTYIEGPMLWHYDIVNQAFFENSNIYTGSPNGSPDAIAVMLINSATAGNSFTYKARLTAGDDDGFGLIFGYANSTNFYRVTFARQNRTSNLYPWNGWNVDRMINNVATNLFGDGVDGISDPNPTFLNTQYVPFDVTIGVTNGLFSLTVLDDPVNGGIEYRLVESQPIAGLPANGRVGIFSWGMEGSSIAGFRIQNPALAPTALAGDLSTLLTNWTPVLPLRASGAGLDAPAAIDDLMGNAYRANWSLGINENGPIGALLENSDALGGNDAEGNIDFAAPTIVAGDTNWTDYLMTARITPGDDDGHGIILRYQDERNFYRIALRAQTSASGTREGLSIQKVVDGLWEEVYFDSPVRFDPPTNVPYDISALIVGDRLQIRLVANPTGAPQVFNYGPFIMTGATVPSGKIGFFSWAMNPATAIDFVRVVGIDGIPLQVASLYGSPAPAAGLHGFTPDSSVTASVGSPVESTPGVRRVVTGWRGTGSVPAAGTGTNVTFTITEFSELTWDWVTEVQLDLVAPTGGQVTGASSGWHPEGTNLTLVAQPNAGFVFTGWSGSVASVDSSLNIVLDRPISLQAQFEADSDNDGLPDSWEQANFGDLAANAAGDADNDGVPNIDEFRRGTSPIASETLLTANSLTSRWENVQRDPALPGQLVVRDFGSGFRGVWENSNDFREAEPTNPGAPNLFVPIEQAVANVSFEGPRLIISDEIWQESWNNFTGSAIFDFGDNDGGMIYFRYQNESNWCRATIVAENNAATWRAPYGLSIQKRSNGIFSEISRTEVIAGDPSDTAYYKRIRLAVTAEGPNFTVTATGWNTLIAPADWDIALEGTLAFTDPDHPNGRFGIGVWGQSGGNTATASNPVNAGMLIEDVVISVNGQTVFSEDWQQAPLAAELPAGWIAPLTGTAAGTWQMSAHGAIIQTAGFAPATTATLTQPRADAETSILVSPEFSAGTYLLNLGLHPFDDDGQGFVYDYQDTNNYARVIFAAQGSGNGRIPQGVSVSRKSGGTWSDVIAGDTSFVYTAGQPFMIDFARNTTSSRMTLWEVDNPANRYTWSWAEPSPNAANRYGFAAWGQQDAHFTHAAVSRIQGQAAPASLEITSVTVNGSMLQMQIANPNGASFDVQASPVIAPAAWTPLASNQSGTTFSTPMTGDMMFYRLVAR